MKIYNKPEIETLALEMIDVITASIPGEGTGTVQEQLNAAGVSNDQINELNESIGAMQVDGWNW